MMSHLIYQPGFGQGNKVDISIMGKIDRMQKLRIHKYERIQQ